MTFAGQIRPGVSLAWTAGGTGVSPVVSGVSPETVAEAENPRSVSIHL